MGMGRFWSCRMSVLAVIVVGVMAFSSLAMGSASGMFLESDRRVGPEPLTSKVVLPSPALPSVDRPGVSFGGDYPPFADAGADQIITAGSLVTFDASGSFDIESEITDYVWTFDDMGYVELHGVSPSYVFSSNYRYPVDITLTVEDSMGQMSSDTMQVTVWRQDVVVVKSASTMLGSYMIWTVAAPADGDWTLELENYGLASMLLTGWERGPSGSARVLSRTVIFPGQGAYPYGTAYGPTIHISAGFYYQVTAMPLGTIGRYAIVRNVFEGDNLPPIAEFSMSLDGANVTVDASASFDPNGDSLTYVWDWGDGSKFMGISASHSYASAEAIVVRLTVQDPAGLESTKEKSARPLSQTYTLYDMFQQPWGEWWPWRYKAYTTDIILNNETGKYTMIYNPDKRGLQGIIYAPYRWNVNSVNMANIGVADPEFMPVLGTPVVPGASATLDIYFEYLDSDWWYGYWHPYWNFSNDIFELGQKADGYYLGVKYTAVMNREAAESWLGLPMGEDPTDWWMTNSASYLTAWSDWISYEGNVRLDIYSGYEWPYSDMGTKAKLIVLPGGDIMLEIGHLSWGYEVLMTRWFTEIDLCRHEPYYEDASLSIAYHPDWTDLAFDAVCQYNLHAIRANQSTTNEGAWVWEPQLIDYVDSSTGHPSKFDPWMSETYRSWNAGDPQFGREVAYESGVQYFNLTDYQRFVIQMPLGDDVLGYYAQPVPFNAITRIIIGRPSDYGITYPRYPRGDGSIYNYEAYWPLMYNGTMSLGWVGNWTGNPDLGAMYEPVTNTVTIQGPATFDNTHHDNGALYHGAPWIEFNVTPMVSPVAAFTVTSVSDLNVTVDGDESYDPDGWIVEYAWYWGDGANISGPWPYAGHIYSGSGNYTITLTVTDNSGMTDTAYEGVFIPGSPPTTGNWTAPVSIGTGTALGLYGGVEMDTNADGNAVASWVDEGASQWEVYANLYFPGIGWQGAELLGAVADYSYFTCAGIDGAGNATVAWITGHTTLVCRSYSASTHSWGPPVEIVKDAYNLEALSLAVEANGRAVMAWCSQEGSTWELYACTRSVGNVWSAPVQIESSVDSAYNPSAAISAGGDAVVAFLVWGYYGGDVYASYYDAFVDAWYPEQLLENVTGDAKSVRASMDDYRNAFVVWDEWTYGLDTVYANVLRRGWGWGDAQKIEPLSESSLTNPEVCAYGNCNAVVSWVLKGAASSEVRTSRYINGSGWSSAVTTAAGCPNTWRTSVGADSLGHTFVTWSQSDGSGNPSGYFVETAEWDSVHGWSVPNVVSWVSNTTGPVIAASETGTFTLVWDDFGAAPDVWASVYVEQP
jgi:hypothetical protein